MNKSRWALPPWSRIAAVSLLLILPFTSVGWKVARGGYDLESLVPVETYRVGLSISMSGHGDSLNIQTFLPQSDERVTLLDEFLDGDLPIFSERFDGGNRVARWSGDQVEGHRDIHAEFTAYSKAQAFEIDPRIPVPGRKQDSSSPHLAPTETIQVEDPQIAELAEQLAPTGSSMLDGLRAIHEYTHDLGNVSFKGTTDALTSLRLGEASCNGKSRLFVALARHQGIPARLVGGLILRSGSKRTSHQWLEVQIGPYWVPFCPLNDYFAEIPAHYLPLYRGDHALFRYSRDINFDYRFKIKRELAIGSELMARSQRDQFSLMSISSTLARAGIPVELLKVLLMIPLGTLVLVILRNVVGLNTFGTYLPVLIAVAARQIGLGWGLLMFLLLILMVYSVRSLIRPMNLLHLPQMAILLTFSIIFMLTLAAIGVRLGNINLSSVSMFPIAILAITTERFSLMIEEEGAMTTFKIILQTAIAIAACFVVMNAIPFQILFLTFPELVLVVVFLDIWIGHWVGLRVSEFWRFRAVLNRGKEASHV
jgi:hypothetical protein